MLKKILRLFLSTVLLTSSLAVADVIINEIDSDQVGTPDNEFVELYNAGASAQSLNGYVLVLFNGSNNEIYGSFDLTGQSIPAGDFFVIGSASVTNFDFTPTGWTTDELQQGADAVALYQGTTANLAVGTVIGSIPGTETLVDAIVYDSSDADATGLLAVLNTAGGQINEDENGAKTTESIARVPDGGTALDTSNYLVQAPTPGVSNGGPALTVSLDNYTVAENAGSFAIFGTVTSNTTVGADLTVTLSSSDTTELDVEAGSVTVTITAGTNSADFDLDAIDDGLTDGNQVATISATAAGYTSGSVDVIVTDDETVPSGILLNEIRFQQSGTDTEEYIELYGSTANASLTGLSLVVIGDDPGNTTGTGYIMKSVNLSGNLNGNYHVTGTLTLSTADQVETMGFEDNENTTVLLVNGFTGTEGDDLDTNDDGTLDVTPWTSIQDGVVLTREGNPPASGNAYSYATSLLLPSVGPDGSNVPAHVERQTDGTNPWGYNSSAFGDTCFDTPGTTNGTQVPRLTISLSPAAVVENAGTGAITATITRNCATTSGALVVNLTSSDTSELIVPVTATIPDSSADVAVALDAVDEALLDGSQTVTVTATATGFTTATADATISDDDTPVFTDLVINEIDFDTSGTDAAEFIELYNKTGSSQALDGLVLVLFNGSGDVIYDQVDLSGHTIPANGYFVIGAATVPNVDITPAGWTTNILQNGPDAVALYNGLIANLANSTTVTAANTSSTLVDAIVYGSSADAELLAALLPGQTIAADEATSGADSTSRQPDGGTALDMSTLALVAPTPGATNGAATLALTLAYDISTIAETAGAGAVTATVTRNGDTTSALTVTITNPDTSEISTPATVDILAGQASANFSVDILDDALVDGSQVVTVTVTAASYADGTGDITVTDDEVPSQVILINEVMYDPDNGTTVFDSNQDGTPSTSQDEYVELVNNTGSTIDLANYTLSDESGVKHTFASPTSLSAGQALVVFGGGTVNPATFPGVVVLISDSSLGLNNSGDSVILHDGSGNIVDTYTWSANTGNGESETRSPDLTGGFAIHTGVGSGASGTPGFKIDGSAFVAASGPTVVAITSCSGGPGGTFTINWTLDTPGAVEVKTSTDLVTWTLATTPSGSISSGTTTYVDADPPAGKFFYRVEIP